MQMADAIVNTYVKVIHGLEEVKTRAAANRD